MKEQKGSRMIYERPRVVVLDDSEGLVAQGLDCLAGSGASTECKPGPSAVTKCKPGAGN